MKQDSDKFCRHLQLKEYFFDSDYTDESIVGKSDFNPPRGRDTHLDNFISYVQQYPVGDENNKHIRSNLTKIERKALTSLGSNKDIIIKEADKGSAVIIMDRQFYSDKIRDMLGDTTTYKIIDTNIDRSTMNKIKALIDKYDCCTDKERNYLTTFDYRTSQFYGLPKIHKSQLIIKAIEEQNCEYIEISNPADLQFRPIVAGPTCPTHRLSHLIDVLISPLVKNVKSYIRDDIDFLGHLPQRMKDSDIFAIFDVKCLYSNITHELGIQAISFWIDKTPHMIHPRFPKDFILDAIKIILENNNFEFGDTDYLQTLGTAMGTKFAPNYATLVLGYLETKMYNQIQSEKGVDFRIKIENSFKRYLDDCWCIWDTEFADIQYLYNILNSLDTNIKYTMESNRDNQAFLDILVKRNPNNQIVTDIHYKTTDTKQYLHFKSSHPRHTKINVPFNLARRICTIVSDDTTKKTRLEELKTYLAKQEYPLELIISGINRANSIPLEELRQTSPKSNTDIIPYVTTFNPNITDSFNVIKTNIPYLEKSERMSLVLKESKIIKSNRQPPNLKRLLTRAKFNNDTNFQVTKCNNKRCKLCENIIESSQFKFGNKTVKVNANMDCNSNCNTRNCIYEGRSENNAKSIIKSKLFIIQL